MTDYTIFHNPRCSKSRQTLALLDEAGVQPQIVEYLKTPPTVEQLGQLLDALGADATDIIRFKEAIASDLGLNANDDRSRDEWLQLIADHPKLLERPIVLRRGASATGDRAVVGRPPENVQALMG